MSQPQPDPHHPSRPSHHRGAVDPDVDLHDPEQGREWSRHRLVLPVIAVGGMLGASARYAAAQAWPGSHDGVPWTTLGVNAGGSAGTTGSYVLEVRATGRTPDEARAVTDSVADQLVQTSRDRFATESADNIVELEDLVAQTQADLASRRD